MAITEKNIQDHEQWNPTKLQSIIWAALMDCRFNTRKPMLEILDETCDWLDNEFYMLEYDPDTTVESQQKRIKQ